MYSFRRVERGPVKEPGTYLQWPSTRGKVVLAELVCPAGHGGSLISIERDGNHMVLPDGSVNPSYVCPEKGCRFHEWIVLQGWIPGEKQVFAIAFENHSMGIADILYTHADCIEDVRAAMVHLVAPLPRGTRIVGVSPAIGYRDELKREVVMVGRDDR